jgi:hypothetical protein
LKFSESSFQMVVLNKVHVLSEALVATSSQLCVRQRELIADLLNIYPIEPVSLALRVKFTISHITLCSKTLSAILKPPLDQSFFLFPSFPDGTRDIAIHDQRCFTS